MKNLDPGEFARFMLHPDPAAQEEIRRRRAAEERSLADRRMVAVMVLVGGAVGAGAAYFAQFGVGTGVLRGGIAAAIVGWITVAWRRRWPAP